MRIATTTFGCLFCCAVTSLVLYDSAYGTTDVSSTKPGAPVVTPTPESAYRALVRAVKSGDFAAARQHLEPFPKAVASLVDAEMRTLCELERLKTAMITRFGEQSVEQLSMGFVSERTLASARSEIAGDEARISLVAPDTGEREVTDLRLIRIEGRWLVEWTNISSPVQSREETEELRHLTPEQVKQRLEQHERALRAISDAGRRLRDGAFHDAEEVQEAVIRAWVFPQQRD